MGNTVIKPSDFAKECPWDCIFQQCEYETVASMIMLILERKGNEWRKISWEEYEKERIEKSGSCEGKSYFDKVAPYCVSWQKAITFSPTWAAVPGTIKQHH